MEEEKKQRKIKLFFLWTLIVLVIIFIVLPDFLSVTAFIGWLFIWVILFMMPDSDNKQEIINGAGIASSLEHYDNEEKIKYTEFFKAFGLWMVVALVAIPTMWIRFFGFIGLPVTLFMFLILPLEIKRNFYKRRSYSIGLIVAFVVIIILSLLVTFSGP